jgi:hypothetical protein
MFNVDVYTIDDLFTKTCRKYNFLSINTISDKNTTTITFNTQDIIAVAFWTHQRVNALNCIWGIKCKVILDDYIFTEENLDIFKLTELIFIKKTQNIKIEYTSKDHLFLWTFWEIKKK